MEAGLHGGDAGAERARDLGVAAAFLHQREEDAVLRAKLGESVAESIELLGIDGAGGLGHIFVLGREGEKNAAEFLPAEVVDAGVAREAEEPRLELLRRLKPRQGADHFDKHELREILDRITPPDDRINKTGHAVLVGDDEVALGLGVFALGAADEVDQWGRRSWFHAVGIAIFQPDAGARPKMRLFDGARGGLRQHFPAGNVTVRTMLRFSASRLLAAGSVALACLAFTGCETTPPREPSSDTAAAKERLVAMSGTADFFGGKITATITVSRGSGRKPGHPAGGPDQRGARGGGRMRPNSRPERGESPAEEADPDSRVRQGVGSPLPPVTLRLKLENHGPQPVAIEILEVSSELGNFAVRPATLSIAPAQTAEPDPMFSKLGVTSDEIPVKVILKISGARETQTIAVLSVRTADTPPLSK